MRNIFALAELIKSKVPLTFDGKRLFFDGIDELNKKFLYRAPELGLNWFVGMANLLEYNLGKPDQPWKQDIQAIFADTYDKPLCERCGEDRDDFCHGMSHPFIEK